MHDASTIGMPSAATTFSARHFEAASSATTCAATSARSRANSGLSPNRTQPLKNSTLATASLLFQALVYALQPSRFIADMQPHVPNAQFNTPL